MFVAKDEWCHKCNSMHPKYLDGCPNNPKEKEERKFIIGTGKQGYIEYKIALLKALEFTEEEINFLKEALEKNLKEGYYTIK